MKNTFLLFLLAGLMAMASCKKEVNPDISTPSTTDVPAPVSDLVKDTALLVAQDLYLWYDKIPATLNARDYNDPNEIMEAIKPYSLEAGFSGPVDRWSFAVPQKEWDDVSAGVIRDFGMNVFFRQDNDLRVRSVEKTSPAGKAGVQRGWRIMQIDGNANMNPDNASFIVDKVYNSTSTAFRFLKPDGNQVSLTLTGATYQEDPLYLDTVYTISGKKTGYLVFNSFLGDTTAIFNGFQRIFNRFASEGVSDLVVDLRYNGGGYVHVQEKLADYLTNNAANGKLMMKEQFNKRYTRYNENTFYRKKGSLNLSRIFFIVSKNTASASELLINNLKPYMDVKVVGPEHTYGKPVGFFPYPVGDWYVFPVSFRSTNGNGEGNYFDGIGLDAQAYDGLDRNWGDVNESSLAVALRYIATGSFGTGMANGAVQARTAEVSSGNQRLDSHRFRGAVDVRMIR